jgi:hypothetical protein
VRSFVFYSGPYAFWLVKVYCPLVGAFIHINHYITTDLSGVKRKVSANCKFVCDPSKGFNDGFISLIAWGPRKSGIAPNRVLQVDFGDQYDPSKKPDLDTGLEASPVKKMRGALEAMWEKQREAAPAEGKEPEGKADSMSYQI